MDRPAKEILPQGGSDCTAVRESATPSASSPSYSGGGNRAVRTPLAKGNSGRGGPRFETSFEELIGFNFSSPDKVSVGQSAGSGALYWEEGSLECRTGEESESELDSDDLATLSSASSEPVRAGAAAEDSRSFRKRPRTEEDRGSSGSEEVASARKIPTSRRGKGREGGKGRLPASKVAGQRAEGLVADGRPPVEGGHRAPGSESSGGEPDDSGQERVRRAGFAEVVEAALRDVALKRKLSSKNKAISEAMASILAAAEGNPGGPPRDEMSKLRAEVARLAAATERLQRENAGLRADLARLQGAGPQGAPEGGRRENSQPVPQEGQVLDLVRQEMAAFQARFSVLEGIVLRPPLAASGKAPGRKAASYAAAAAATPGSSGQDKGSGPAPAKPVPGKPDPAPGRKRKGGVAARTAKAPAPSEQQLPPASSPSAPPPAQAEWQVAGEKRKAGKAARAAKRRERKRRQKARSVAAALRPPKTAAVVLTLQPDAVKRGVTYADVLTKAKEAINLGELGIVGGLRLRVTMTGARMLEIPGAASGPTADALAERLRASLSADDARVSRPTKRIDMRILGLDDSVTEAEVVAAVVRTGGCSAEEVKAGTLRPDNTGMRTIVVSCPVSAAKTISEGRRFLVGWVSAQVKLLEPRPLRCFRCQVGHHVGAQCTSEVDRSGLCFRCGQPGHRAGSCDAAPHCAVCAAAGKPADHWAGGRACAPPAKAGNRRKPSATAVSAATAATAAASSAAKAGSTAAAATATAAVEPLQRAPEGAEMECQ